MNDGLTDDERGYFMEMEATFHSPGWAKIQKEIDESLEGAVEAAFWNAASWEELIEARINIRNLRMLRDYQEIVSNRRAQTTASRLVAASDEVAGITGDFDE
jgi:hypothetical protein